MDAQQIQTAVTQLRETITERAAWSTPAGFMNITPRRYNPQASGNVVSTASLLSHGLYMLDQLEEFVRDGRMEKANRWLGFLQGMLWSQGIISIEDGMDMNRSKDSSE